MSFTKHNARTASCHRKAPAQAQGFVLIVVLVTIALLSISAYTFSLLMLQEQKATKLMGRQLQSRYLVESGVDYLRLYLTSDEATLQELGGIWDNANQFTNQIVSVNPIRNTEIGRFRSSQVTWTMKETLPVFAPELRTNHRD